MSVPDHQLNPPDWADEYGFIPPENSLMSEKTKLLEKLRSMKGHYPMSDEALRWYQGFHCTESHRVFHIYDHFPSFNNGWDSAIEKMIAYVKNMPDF